MKGGYQRRTTDGVIGISGQPVRVYGANITSGASAGSVIFYDGTDGTGIARLEEVGEPNITVGVKNIPSGGLYFPAGCYVDLDAQASDVQVEYEQVIAR